MPPTKNARDLLRCRGLALGPRSNVAYIGVMVSYSISCRPNLLLFTNLAITRDIANFLRVIVPYAIVQ